MMGINIICQKMSNLKESIKNGNPNKWFLSRAEFKRAGSTTIASYPQITLRACQGLSPGTRLQLDYAPASK